MVGLDREQLEAKVLAARTGDRQALGDIVSAHLPMLYTVVGRSVGTPADIDDVVQETLTRVLRYLPGLREPARFSGWLLAIAGRQAAGFLKDQAVARRRSHPLSAALDIADPDADVADLAISRLHHAARHRRDTAAARWLDPRDRRVLALWWLETEGVISRGVLAETLAITTGGAAVRVQRARSRFGAARECLIALEARPRCPGLADMVRTWNGRPDGVWRKRIGRHVRGCPRCAVSSRNTETDGNSRSDAA
ncbi:sigma-70 family RNA polymerase sigma factor [Actinoplanes sp. NBRC 101535]|uniref:RNA polymerase sigma factor n=1 Tax=Actinoplanes sp. NBRC 101535 TaxID=3032196 RepID=UPI002556E27E|nr:sigma-70 family RNA polymerase sigma factor [Actinoplanes sp. NBRC 101535]